MNTRKPKIGEIVLFTSNPDDTTARSNHNDEAIPAIVTRVWSEICVNVKIVPDCGPMQDRTSVVHVSANPAGYHFHFFDEYYDAEKLAESLQYNIRDNSIGFRAFLKESKIDFKPDEHCTLISGDIDLFDLGKKFQQFKIDNADRKFD